MVRGLELLLGVLAGLVFMVGVAHGFAPGPLLSAAGTAALGLVGLGLSAQLLLRLVAPYLGAEAAWRGLAQALPELELQTFGGLEPPRGWAWLEDARVSLRPHGEDLLIQVHRHGPALPDWSFLPAGPGRSGDPALDARITALGPPDTLCAALDPALRARLLATLPGPGIRLTGDRALWHDPRALRQPEATAATIHAVLALMRALADAPRDEAALLARATGDPESGVRAHALRTLLATYPLTPAREALADAALADPAPAVQRAAAEALAQSDRPGRRRAARRLLEASLAAPDPAEQAHAAELLFEAYPDRVARRVLVRSLGWGEGPLAPEVAARVPAAAEPELQARLARCPVEALVVLIPALAEAGREATLLALAHHRRPEVAQRALAALGRVGTLAAVGPLLALVRASWAPARRGAALRVARRLQARHGVPAQGALSDPPAERGEGALSEPAHGED
jgi:hypothetical protein